MTERRSDDAGPLAPRRTLGRVQEPVEQGQGSSTYPGSSPAGPRLAPSDASTDGPSGTEQAAAGATTVERPIHSDGAPTTTDQPESAPPQDDARPADRTRPAPAPAAPKPDRPRPAPSSRPRPSGSRRATLRLARLDPWSVMKTALLLSIAFGIVIFVAVAVVWSVLDAANVWESVNRSIRDIVGGETAKNVNVENYIGMQRVLGFTALVAVIDVILLTAIATLTAFLYNLAAGLLGGLEVTLAED